jgi:ABC-type transport system substrate-binding protein
MSPLAAAVPGVGLAATAQAPRKVLRVAFSSAESSFDPARIIDLYSRAITAHIFESLYAYDHLARPSRFVPRLAADMPEASADFKVWTVKLRPGIYFADDPAFKGQRRELVADDVLYAFKRVVDPANKSPAATSVLDDGFVGLAELRKAAIDSRKPFDYDAPVEGLKALDRYTVRFTLKEARPRFIQTLAANDLLGAQAREVVAFYGETIGEHPVGTGPFRLKRWVRGSKIVLERNPQFRDMRYEALPAVDDVEGQALLARFKGRSLPMVDEVEVSVIEENQPAWLSFLNAQIDGLVAQTGSVPLEFANLAAPNGQIAPNLAKRGVRLYRSLKSDCGMMYFNMEDPVIGGYTPEKVALRRAISLAYDVEREITQVRRGQAVPAQSPILPGTSGYDATFRSTMSEYNVPRAKALLDMHGYIDRDGDGWRETPDGKPLKLTMSTEPEQIYRLFNDVFKRCMTAVGIRCDFEIAQWPTHMQAALGGSLQMWMLGSSADAPDGQSSLARWYGPQAGQQNLSRFKLKAFDEVYERMLAIPDGPERNQLFLQAKRLAVAFMPYKVLVHRIANEVMHPWVTGYRRALFWQDWWHMVDVDPTHSIPPAHTPG